MVAPFRGAWIEIPLDHTDPCSVVVAPFRGAWIEIHHLLHFLPVPLVAPFRGAWIEISSEYLDNLDGTVAPFRGAWIEICFRGKVLIGSAWSLPLGERGLKFHRKFRFTWNFMSLPLGERGLKFVDGDMRAHWVPSLPLGERGLKFNLKICLKLPHFVAPFRGAWIEIG